MLLDEQSWSSPGASRAEARASPASQPEQLEPSHRTTLSGTLWSDGRSGALGGGGEEGRSTQAGVVGSGPVGNQALSLASCSLSVLTCVLSLEHLVA